MESITQLNMDMQEVEKNLTDICQKIIQTTISTQKEEIFKQLEIQKKSFEHVTTSPIIKLNVGGKRFMTTLATLTSSESKLSKMFTGALPIIKDDKNVFFIDRNGDYFSYILDYLRENTLYSPSDTFLSKKIKEEMEYYEIKSQPVSSELWSWDSAKQAGVALSNNNMTVTKTGTSGCGITYGTKLFEPGSGLHTWKVKVTHVNNHYWVCAGIVDEALYPFSTSFSYGNSWAFTSYGEVFKMTGSGAGIMLSDGDIMEMEYNIDSGEFKIEVPNKSVKLKAIVKGQKIRPFGYVWTIGDCLTLTFD